MTESVQYCLRVIVGKSYGEELVLSSGEERVIGSDGASDLRLSDDGVDKRHARVELEGEELRVVEIAERRSMRVNGTKRKIARLENGDQIALGSVTLRVQRRVRYLDEAEEKGVPSPGADDDEASAAPSEEASLSDEREAKVSEPANGEHGPERDTPPPSSPLRGGAAALLTAPNGQREVRVADDVEPDERIVEAEGSVALGAAVEQGLWWPKDELPPLELQHVWFDLARDDRWRSLAIIPTDESTPALPVAHAFARMASLNPNAHVLVVDATPREPGRERRAFAGTIASHVKQFPQSTYDFLDASSLGMNDAEVAHLYIPQLLEYISSGTARYNKVLIALGSVVTHARSIPVARAVDAVLLGVQLGASLLPDVARTVEIVGRERVMGTLVVQPVD